MSTLLHEVHRLGQSIWYDNIRRGLITSGELQHLIEIGVTGITSNPTIFEKAIAGSTDYDSALKALAVNRKSLYEVYEALAVEDIRQAADLLRTVYESTEGADGYVSLEVNPSLARDTDGTVAEARRLFAALARPNVMVKVPATPEGIPSIRHLISEGINVNVTLIFSLEVYRQVMEAYISGLEDLARAGGDLRHVASVASFFVSRVDTAIDTLLEEGIRRGEDGLKPLLGKAAIANARLAYREFKSTFAGRRFAALRARGARVQRPLWASTGAKNPAYSDVMYLESLIGPDTVDTVPPATLTAFLDHGRVEPALELDLDEAAVVMEKLALNGISMTEVTARLLAEGVKAFADSFQKLLFNIEEKRTRLVPREHVHPGASLGPYLPVIEQALTDLEQNAVVARIWRRDHTVWKPTPKEIADRLGWLNVTDVMCEQVPALEAFAGEVREAGVRHVVLLGMGGTSLGPEVLRQAFGSAQGYPELVVLDSTVPAWVQAVIEAIDPSRTLFLVSSKSGATLETLSLYRYFRALVEKRTEKGLGGRHFVAITDPGTPLERLSREQGFRRTFVNPADIGGRYSALSYYGLVPAALIGVDLVRLLDRADCMREGCASCVSSHDNPGAWLGVAMGALALKGRDKLTLLASPTVASFGLWVEQLIAESTGKEARGIVPVAGEPWPEPEASGEDRLFVFLRLEGDGNTAVDAAVERLESAGHPVVRLDLRDRYDLGAEFFRWEFATAVAGTVLGINPFGQPNVQEAKDSTDQVLREYRASGRLPDVAASSSLAVFLAQATTGDYLAVMAYLHPTPEIEEALAYLRRRVTQRHHLATTLGYGPRFLHSTGQLHKGGPNTGLFLQLVQQPSHDISIPGEPHTFGVLTEAQARGDLRTLQARGRRVVRVELESDLAEGIRKLAEAVQ